MNANRNQADVSLDDVRHIADLSNLRLTEEEEPRMQRDLNAILAYVAELNTLDTAAVEPMAQVGEVIGGGGDGDSREELRSDEERASVERARVMESAPDSDGSFFKVPKVIER